MYMHIYMVSTGCPLILLFSLSSPPSPKNHQVFCSQCSGFYVDGAAVGLGPVGAVRCCRPCLDQARLPPPPPIST